MNNPLFYCLVAALTFGAWPLMARFSQLSASWIAISIATSSTLTILIGLLPKASLPTKSVLLGLVICLIGGVLNGLGMLSYSKVLSTASWDVSKYIPLMTVMIILIAAIGGFALFKEALNWQKALGLTCALAAVWLLK